MKKKISSFITAAFILLMCVFASACGDKYKNLEFKVYYAFSEDAATWFDASEGVSLNYRMGDDESEDDSSLVFDEYGATIYLKIEVENVKSKHIDKITVSPKTTEGFSFSPIMVNQNQVFSLHIDGNVNNSLKLYENNSGKKYEVPVVISRTLEKIEVNTSIKPAMPLTSGGSLGSINLASLEEKVLVYYPINETNQKGVKYSIESIGRYVGNPGGGENEYVAQYNQSYASQYASVDNGVLKITNSDFFGPDAYVIRVKATSVFYDGTKDGVKPISAVFDVYVVDSEAKMEEPVVVFDGGEEVKKQINIYEYSSNFATSTVVIDMEELPEDLIYNDGVLTRDGEVTYSVALYVLDENYNYVKCDFENQGNGEGVDANGNIGINGLYVKKEDNKYTFSIASRDVEDNLVKIAYELEGFDYSYSQTVDVSKTIKIVKGSVPTGIRVNDEKTLNEGDVETAQIFSISNNLYRGLKLKLTANTTDDPESKIVFESNPNLSITNEKGESVSWIYSGDYVYVKFVGNAANAVLNIKTLNVPNYYNETALNLTEYLTVSYSLEKLVTADSFEFVADVAGSPLTGNALLNASKEDSVYVKVNYSGESLVSSTINLKSLNDKVLFKYGKAEMELSDEFRVATYLTATGKCDVYEIPILATNSKEISKITITAGDEVFNVNSEVQVETVFVLDKANETINIDAISDGGVREFAEDEVSNGAYNFAVAKGETSYFTVKDGAGNTKTITKIECKTEKIEGENFSDQLFIPFVSNTSFQITSYISGKTQVLQVFVTYYVVDEDIASPTYGQIVARTQIKKVQIAVFDSVGLITRTPSNETIGYINSFYSEIGSSEVAFTSNTLDGGTPSNTVVFTGLEEGTIIEKSGASQIMIGFDADDYQAITQSELVDVYYVVNGTKVSLLSNNGTVFADNKNTVEIEDDTNILNGSFVVQLKTMPTGLKEISMTLSALRFGVKSNISRELTIKIADVDKAERIVVDGDFKQTSSNSKELQMSFMGVVGDYGVDVAEFSASLEFATQSVPQGKLRFDDIDTALTYILYRYQIDENGNPIYDDNGKVVYTRIDNSFLNIQFNNGKVKVQASKHRGGGLFKLVLATKDSYNQKVDPSSIDLEESHFDKTLSITVRISDGSKQSAYIIDEVEDLIAINNNLGKNFVLTANIGEDEPVKIQPIGVVNINGSTVVKPFTGTFSGQFTTILSDSKTKTSSYSIKVKIEETVDSSYGDLSGLFAIIGEEAVVSNINLTVQYASKFTSTSNGGLFVGGLAGVNNGKIDNVQVVIDQPEVDIGFESSRIIRLGGIVGLNSGLISNSTSESYSTLSIVSGQHLTHSVGMVAGVNDVEGTISGSYLGKESLNNYIYDVVANIKIKNTNELNDGMVVKYYVGGAVGTNYGIVEKLLVGGQISMSSEHSGDGKILQSGAFGGIVGFAEEDSSVYLATALSFNITSASKSMLIGGVVGEAKKAEINAVKYISAITNIGGDDVLGILSGKSTVGGVVGLATNGSTINYATVESFIDSVNNETFYSIQSETIAYGLGDVQATNVWHSFVNANIKSLERVCLTTVVDSFNDVYFIGKVSCVELLHSEVKYTIVNGKIQGVNDSESYELDVEKYMVQISDASTITDWTNIYYVNELNYVEATEYDSTKTYKKFDVEKWQLDAYKLVDLTESNGIWRVEENYNIIKFNGVKFFFPYIVRSYTEEGTNKTEPLQIVQPQSIVANVNQEYVTSSNSVYVKEFNYADYAPLVKESVIVNFFKDASDEDNAHNIFSISNDGLLDLSILPSDAQGGYVYEILGDGHNYAYINSKKQIVFTRASGQTPILVRVYSVFNHEIQLYVVFYSQSLATELTLSSSSVYYANEPTHDYEVNVYTGQNNKVIVLNAENGLNGEDHQTIFDVDSLAPYLVVEKTSTNATSKLAINSNNSQSITLRIRDDLTDDERIGANEYEIITFSLFLKAEYFGSHVQESVLVGTIRLKVNLYNSATSIHVDGSDAEITTSDDVDLNITLTTEYVKESLYDETSIRVENVLVNNEGELCYDLAESDGIRIKFNVVEGQEEVNTLCVANGVEHFAELFVENAQILSSLYKAKDGKVLGYQYSVFLELDNKHIARYINSDIKFNIVIYAVSNSEVNNEESPIEILLKPANLKTVKMENYVVKSLNMFTDYTNIVANNNIETSIIEPGGLGNVMMIYLEPSYSQVTSVEIQTSSLYVPSLGRSVQVKFTQLALDHRAGDGVFTTLSAERANAQVGDTLELNLLSEIDRYGNNVYTGILCVRIHIEEPFVGLETSMIISLKVKTENNPEGIIRTKELLTSYLPGTEISYDSEKAVDNGYLIQKGTSNNEVTLKIYGYQFNSNPNIEFVWELPETSTYNYVGGNRSKITDGKNEYAIGDYISYYLDKNIDDIIYDSYKDSYTLKLFLNAAEDIPAPFRLSAELYLVTKDGQLKTSPAGDNTLIFYPTEYILNSVYVADLTQSGSRNIPINQQREIELKFTTDSETNDLSNEIYQALLDFAQKYDVDNGYENFKLASLFSYYKNGTIDFSDYSFYNEFIYSLVKDPNGVEQDKIKITGLEKFNSLIKFDVHYDYEFIDGEYVLVFGKQGKVISTTFTLNIYAVEEDNEVIVYSAEDIYNSTTQQWNLVEGEKYVLVNDIVLENVVPITTKIGSFDGNNRVISIKNFVVGDGVSEYGLFANIGTYTVENPETEQQVEKQTILKNMIVDYGKFEGTLALNNLTSENLVFGGLVGTNNGGLIYNCDVMNLDLNRYGANSNDNIDIIVASNANITFGGLVGVNGGNITNSRVGRDSYTKITATATTESSVKKYAGGLSFRILNAENTSDETINQFAITAGGFVGENTGIISSSYATRTNLKNYSTNETTNLTAGFVGTNRGTISYSYAKGDDAEITLSNPYATNSKNPKYTIQNVGNGIVSGFVYNNLGTISNAYANLELKTDSAYISGFVYNNTGKISESYAATIMNSGLVDSYAEQPFVGVNTKGDLLSNGTLENTYYLMRSSTDNPYTDEDKDVAQALNEENFQNSEYLVGFAFVLSNSKDEREQGIWSYYTTNNQKRILPELMNANLISHSHRFVVDSSAQDVVLRNAVSYAEGTLNNPYTISNVKEFNDVFTGEDQNFVGHVRLINNINFNDDETAIKTRANYTLGSVQSSKTSIEGNGMTIGGIYLDVGDAIVSKIGLFAEIQNTYVKNLNLEFATPKTDGQFSTTTATYSGGLAGLIKNSAIINVTLQGEDTTLTGNNFVGGVAGLVKGNSLIYGIETNLNVKANCNESYLYYGEEDYQSLNIKSSSRYEYENYLKHLSYAGGVAGVMDLTKRANIDYNVQFIDVRGDLMNSKTFGGKKEANIVGEYAGGVAGYASRETKAFKLRYFMGENESIRGDSAVGGLFGVALGGITASQVTAEEETQFVYDTSIGEYVIDLDSASQNAKLNTEEIGNINLLQGDNYVGGLVGVGVDTAINASYSKASVNSGKTVGGLVGLKIAGSINYSYAIPFVNLNENLRNVGGLIGSAYAVLPKVPERNKEITTYETLIKHKGVVNKNVDVQFTYSSLIVDESQYENLTTEQLDNDKISDVKFDYVCADYDAENISVLQSNQNANLMYVYAGPIDYTTLTVENNTKLTNKSSVVDLHRLYNVADSDQTVAFQEVFSGWSLIKYWSLNDKKYFPLLKNNAVDNFIEIDHANDLELIKTNPNGKFKVVKDIQVKEVDANWVISGKFTGVLVGELQSDNRRPTITINGLKPQTANASSGFFEETNNATISNLSFVWVSSASNPAIKNDIQLTMVSGLTCKDENSLISNIEVRVQGDDKNNAHLLKNATISGFGGIVGESVNTDVLGCNFVGQISANLKNVNSEEICVGGIVGYGETNTKNGDSAVINNVSVGASKEQSGDYSDVRYSTTSMELTIGKDATSPVYIGGSVGKADNNVAIASNTVGGIGGQEGYKYVGITLDLVENKTDVYVGGLVGYSKDGMVFNSETSTNITVYGQTSSSMLKVGGLVGEYSLGNPSSTTGISKCNSYSNISTIKDRKILSTNNNTLTMLSTGVAMLNSGATVKQCLFTGEVNTEGSNIKNLYAGGVSAYVNSSERQTVDIEETITDAILTIGTEQTMELYAGGLVGYQNKLNLSYSSALGRVIPITKQDAEKIYVGGLIGLITEESNVNNSYSLTSIIADSISDEAISNLSIGALAGAIPENSITGEEGNINFINVFYSSDFALFADENYLSDGSSGSLLSLGTNLSATTMIRRSEWQDDLKTENNEQNEIWVSLLSNDGTTRLPYLTSLDEAMIRFGILTKPTGATSYDYVSGSAMRPIMIETGVSSDYFFDSNNYNYYLLTLSEDKVVTRKMAGALNGVLIGEDKAIDKTFRVGTLSSYNELQTYRGIVPKVKKHSAISNLHVVIESEISLYAGETTGIIAGYNEGVIFNCSVQGNGINITGGGLIGLIAGLNSGMISYSYSTAEIIAEESVSVAGIAYINEGKILSNYFTGFIEGGESAGIVHTVNGAYGYFYNNYMAGVVTNIVTNAFHASETINGSNNFIDSYSDVKFTSKEYETEKEKEEAYIILKPVQTAELMAGNGLAGEWHFTVQADETLENPIYSFIKDEAKYSKGFGLNYNYPIYRFNKLVSTDGKTYSNDDLNDQLYTGTGGISEDITFDSKAVNTRYSYVVNNSKIDGPDSDTQYYHAFKIPHLGVLSAVHNLLDESRNYVVIYDIDGKISKDVYAKWEAVGSSGNKNGFKDSGAFNGVFVTNKYYAYNTPESLELENENDIYCEIRNISLNGLFGDVNEAYIGNIKLGSFVKLTDSGAIGATVEDKSKLEVNNIEFIKGSTISGTSYIGGLFGKVEGDLVVNKFTTSTGSTANVCLVGDNSSKAGLIAGKLSGTIELVAIKDEENESKMVSTYFAWFKGNGYAGGVVAEMTDGKINGNSNTITFVKTASSGVSEDVFNSVIGGVAGLTSGENKSTIQSVNVNIHGTEIKTNTFGGIVGVVEKSVELVDEIGLTGSSNITFIGNKSDNRYYGLVAGLQKADITSSFILEDGETEDLTAANIKISSISNIVVNCAENPNYDDEETSTGIGAFIGATIDGKIDIKFNAPEIALEVNGVPNVGGFIGYVEQLSDFNVEGEIGLTLTGTTNLGGLFGYLKSNIDASFAGLSDTKFADIIVNGSENDSVKYKNFGGLFGRWDGNNSGSEAIVNYNQITIGETGVAYNVGGVAGKATATTELHNFENQGQIIETEKQLYNNSNFISSGYVENKEVNLICKLMNVGGVFGYVENTSLITNVKNTGESIVSGYQNVGGIVGYISSNTTIRNNTDKDMTNIKTLYKPFTGELVIYCDNNKNSKFDEEEDEVISAETFVATTGEIYGVINVGGIVGYAGKNVSIEQIYTTANVYGNANVGGIVGFSNQAKSVNNYVLGTKQVQTDDSGKEIITRTGAVKGVYYNHVTYDEKAEKEIATLYIPTSVGGLVGTAIDSHLENNLLQGVQVISAEEGLEDVVAEKVEGQTISTISNYMADLAIGEGNQSKVEKFTEVDEIYNLDKQKELSYLEIKTGFGGFVGTLDSATMEKVVNEEEVVEGAISKFSIQSNYMIDIEVDAQLGINVGTYFGTYKFTNSINVQSDGAGKNVALATPRLFSTNFLDSTINVDGAYNVGGIVGFVDGGTGSASFNLTNADLYGYATINLQSKVVGLYVGGLIGKTNANSIKGLEIVSNNNNLDLGNIESSKSVKVLINTDNCYSAGGLIGRAEVNLNATISGNVGEWKYDADKKYDVMTNGSHSIIASGNDKANNFGALIGMLKVGKTENGLTINVEGNHTYPFTINTIENSNYYDGDSEFSSDLDQGLTLRAEAFYINRDTFNIIWSQDVSLYCPDEKGSYEKVNNPLNSNYKGWSSKYTGFKKMQRNIPASENNGAKWDSIAVLFDASQIKHVGTIGNLGLTGKELLKSYSSSQNEYKTAEFDDNYICFTIYEEAPGQETFYSAIGIASANYEYDDEGNKKLVKPESQPANFGDYLLGFFVTNESPSTLYYLDVADHEENGNTKGLTYFDWKGQYKRIDNSSYEDIKWDNEGKGQRELVYCVDNYVDGEAYFIFNVIYENETTKDGEAGNAYLPKDGSLFNVTGMMSESAYNNQWKKVDATDWFGVVSKVVNAVIEVVLLVVSFGAGSAIKSGAKIALKAIAKALSKKIVRRVLLSVLLSLVVSNMLKMQYDATISKQNFVKPSDFSYGYLSTTYSRDIYYEKVGEKIQMVNMADSYYEKNSLEAYQFYSYDRPVDYQINKYVGIKVDVDNANKTVEFSDDGASEVEYVQFKETELSNYQTLENYTFGEEKFTILVAKDENNETYMLSNKYEYVNGQYYIFALYGEIDYRRVIPDFEPENENVTNYIQDSGSYYVHGEFNSSTGYQYDNGYNGNNLNYSSGAYSINGVNIQASVAENNSVQFKYAVKSYDKNNNAFKSNVDLYHWVYGYHWFDGAYYTANGNKGLKNQDKDLVKYATFSFVGNYNSSANYSTLGTEGVDYVIKNYKYLGEIQNNSGNIFKHDGKNYNLNSNRYSFDAETGEYYSDLSSGTHVMLENGEYIQITAENRYSENPVLSGVFKLVDSEFKDSGSATDLTLGAVYEERDEIIVPVYPATFINPYTNKLKNSNSTRDNYVWLYSDDDDSNSILFAPEYYIYEGGYVTKENSGYYDVFMPMDTKTKTITAINVKPKETSDDSLIEKLTFDNLKQVATWNKYKGYYSVSDGDIVENVYQLKDGVLYVKDINYALKDGLLHAMYPVPHDNENLNYNEGLYLTNPKCGLYTRYKYSLNIGKAIDFNESRWSGYEIIPEKGTIINNGVRTRFSESVRVVLGSSNPIRIGKTTAAGQTYREVSAGKINIG